MAFQDAPFLQDDNEYAKKEVTLSQDIAHDGDQMFSTQKRYKHSLAAELEIPEFVPAIFEKEEYVRDDRKYYHTLRFYEVTLEEGIEYL